MAIPSKFGLRAGQLVMVEFGPDPRGISSPGVMVGPLAVMPEMFKVRHAIVVATTNGLTTVVPLSTKQPPVIKAFHHRIPAGRYPGMSVSDDSWTKSDLIVTVSNGRVERPFVGGSRATVLLNAADLKAVRTAMLNALQLGRLTLHL